MISNEFLQIQFDFGEEVPSEEMPIKNSSSKDTEKFVFDLMDIITGPTITYNVGWAHAIPQRLNQDIKLSRLFSAIHKEEMATIPETVAYIMTRTFVAPMDHQWTNIYLWCSAQYMNQYRKWNANDLKDINIPEELNEHEQSLLKKLRSWIYDKRREVVKQRMKESKNNNNSNQFENELF
jgi:hypothetical protein